MEQKIELLQKNELPLSHNERGEYQERLNWLRRDLEEMKELYNNLLVIHEKEIIISK